MIEGPVNPVYSIRSLRTFETDQRPTKGRRASTASGRSQGILRFVH